MQLQGFFLEQFRYSLRETSLLKPKSYGQNQSCKLKSSNLFDAK